jgi:hypothetical protein
MEDGGIFYGHLVYILLTFGLFCGHFVYRYYGYLVYFGMLHQEKSGNPASD